MSASLPAAVLWDMDGTLVDTEHFWMAAEAPLVERFGGTWSKEQGEALVGSGLDDAARVLQAAGVQLPVDEIVQTLTDEVLRQMREVGVPFRPGAYEMLRALRAAGVRTALVTMSMSRMAREVVDLIDFDAFDLILGGDDVTRPKPHPDPYLTACERLGVAPADAVAIEDSPNGMRAAVAAGIPSIGVPHMLPLEGLGAQAIWPTLEGRTPTDIGVFHAAHSRKVNP